MNCLHPVISSTASLTGCIHTEAEVLDGRIFEAAR